MSTGNVNQIVNQLLAENDAFASGELAARTGLTRQGLQPHLRRLTQAGVLIREGSGRGARYRAGPEAGASRPAAALPPQPTWDHSFTFTRAGLEEDEVWRQCSRAVPFLTTLPPAAEAILHFGVTEMVNNAIDHSGGKQVLLAFSQRDGRIHIRIEDDGEGLFQHVRHQLRLASELEALQEVSKGKVTTAPEAHTGQGLFFTSKAVDLFTAESGSLRWALDNERNEVAWGELSPPLSGTRIQLELQRDTKRDLKALFDAYTDEGLAFSRSRGFVRLFEAGTVFVSRSEAKRLLRGLEQFSDVVIDFTGVHTVGQGFADEVFRVWARAHPDTRLTAENMNPAVAAMVARAKAEADARG